MGPPRVAQCPPEAAPLTVGCCARAPGVLLDACGAWVLFFCSLVRASRAVLVWHLLWADPRAHPDSEPSHRRWHKKPRYIHIFQYISILSKRVFLSARVGKTVAVTSSGAAFWIGTMSIVKSRKGNNIEWKKGRRERPQRGNSDEGPHFEVQGYHVLLFVAALMGALWFAGLLPDP